MSKSESRKLPGVVAFRCTEVEKEDLKAIAAHLEISVGELVRRSLLRSGVLG